MKVNKETIKNFLKENKKELLLIGGGVLVGSALTNRMNGTDKEVIDMFRSFGKGRKDQNKILERVLKLSENANVIDTIRYGQGKTGDGIAACKLGNNLTEYFFERGLDPNTPIKGLVIFRE